MLFMFKGIRGQQVYNSLIITILKTISNMNKKFIPNNDIINRAVQNAIDDFLKSQKKTNKVSPRIDGKIPNVSKYVRTFNNIDSFDKEETTK